MLRIGIVGCGKIADDHLESISRISGIQAVAACDSELLMARQLCDRHKIEAAFSDVGEMLAQMKLDAVHLTTPPQSHFRLAQQCLSSGAHVYVEKPFTVTFAEAEELIENAQARERVLTVGHDLQFSHSARRVRALIREGYLGGSPVHLESYYCYDMTDPGYAKALLSDKRHWVRTLPGKLLQNVISHGIARLAEYLEEEVEVFATGHTSAMLRGLGEREIIDELRVTLKDAKERTAYFTFSSQMRPSLNTFAAYGARNGLFLNQQTETVIKLRGAPFVSYADKFLPPLLLAKQQFENFGSNLRRFLANDFHMKAGMKYLMETFYRSIERTEEPPIPYREILLTSRIMDTIFKQVFPLLELSAQGRKSLQAVAGK